MRFDPHSCLFLPRARRDVADPRILTGASQQALLMAGGAYTPVGLLDSYTANLTWAMGLRRLIASHATAVVEVFKVASTSYASYGLSGASLDSATLVADCAGGGGTTRNWYDQSGGGITWTQATLANQPNIVDAGGSYLSTMRFDGSNDILSTAVGLGTPSGVTIYMRGNLRSTAALQIIFEWSSNYNSNDACVYYYDSGTSKHSFGLHDTTPGGYSRSDFNSALSSNVIAMRFDRAASGGANQACLFINGTLQSRAANGDSGTQPDGNMGNFGGFLGARSGASSPAAVDVDTFVGYGVAHSDATVALVSAAIA